MVLACLDLGALVVIALIAMLATSQRAALALAVLSAAWLPLNNGHLEGPVLLSVDARHGLTAMDLFAYAGFVIAVLVFTRGRQSQRRCAIAGSVSILVLGLAISYVVQPS